jgi:MoaE-MoaD fusion protein
MKTNIYLFATLKDKAQTNHVELELPRGSTIAGLKLSLAEAFPGIKSILPRTIASINHQFAFDEDLIPDGAEVALFPPVSGGSQYATIIKIVFDPLDLDEITAQLTLPTTGAVCTFTGIVRGETHRDNPHLTSSLEYEAYIPMAEGKMRQIAEEIRSRWPDIEGIALIQRIGLLQPLTPTVIVACASSHRNNGIFEASHFGIDRLKEIVPIWKKEIGPQGETWVEGEYIPGKGD